MTKTRTLPLDQLVPDPDNERSRTDKEAISRLADSIRQHGILQRLLVRPVNGRFMVVAGHRRLQAAQAAEHELLEAGRTPARARFHLHPGLGIRR